jgi:hypothetical protein
MVAAVQEGVRAGGDEGLGACSIYRDVEAWGLAIRDEVAHRAGTHP